MSVPESILPPTNLLFAWFSFLCLSINLSLSLSLSVCLGRVTIQLTPLTVKEDRLAGNCAVPYPYPRAENECVVNKDKALNQCSTLLPEKALQ